MRPENSDDNFQFDATMIDPALEAEMRSLWDNLPSRGDVDPGMTLKADASTVFDEAIMSEFRDGGEPLGVCVESGGDRDGDEATRTFEGGRGDEAAGRRDAGGTPTPGADEDATLTRGAASSSHSSSSSADSQSSSASGTSSTSIGSTIYNYKQHGTVVLRRSALTGLEEGDAAVSEETMRVDLRRECDFIVKKRIGKGGMGVVYSARQMSMNRDVALKMILPTAKHKERLANRLVAEALVTGDLEHPGIIPVHELGHTADDHLFYAMKIVRGSPWSKTFPGKTERENIDILLRVADAVAFAHDKGVIHRDVKPENVMLGDFGEVLLMDWGLAVSLDARSKAETVSKANAKAGTPAYMAPEMALGREDKIGPASDVYLLGATLFELLTGKKPHFGPNVFICLASAAENYIRETDRDDKLMEVARRAMATEPEDRYGSVKEFQKALGDVMANLESVRMANNARETLAAAERDCDYEGFSQAVFAFREASRLWPENDAAKAGEGEARRRYAACAFSKNDHDLALSCLARLDDAESRSLARRIEKAKGDELRRRRLIKGLAAAVAVTLVAASSVIFWQRGREREALDLVRQREEEAALEVRTRRQQNTMTAYIRNADFESMQNREMELVARQAEFKRLLDAYVLSDYAFAGEDSADATLRDLSRENAAVRAARDWGFDEIAAITRQIRAAEDSGLPITRQMPMGEAGEARLTFSLVPGGEFVMGRLHGYGTVGDPDEYPHRVVLTQPFHLGTTEVTRGVWRAVVGVENREDVEQFFYSEAFAEETTEEEYLDNELAIWGWRTRPLPPEEAELPCTGVSWNDVWRVFMPAAARYVPDGWALSLPTEAQWEYACRAGNPAQFHSGDSLAAVEAVAWTAENGGDRLHPVASLRPNAWGLYDMHGNADELVLDSYAASYYLQSPVSDPECKGDEFFHVIRGGSYKMEKLLCTSSYRDWIYWDARAVDTSFRLVLIELSRAHGPGVKQNPSSFGF